MTEAQAIKLGRLIGDTDVQVAIHHKPFELPEGWVMVDITYTAGVPVRYGIDPEGNASS